MVEKVLGCPSCPAFPYAKCCIGMFILIDVCTWYTVMFYLSIYILVLYLYVLLKWTSFCHGTLVRWQFVWIMSRVVSCFFQFFSYCTLFIVLFGYYPEEAPWAKYRYFAKSFLFLLSVILYFTNMSIGYIIFTFTITIMLSSTIRLIISHDNNFSHSNGAKADYVRWKRWKLSEAISLIVALCYPEQAGT